jgi:hypothetical protein
MEHSQVGVLRLHAVFGYGIVMEGNFSNAELDFCGFHLNASFGAAA